MLQHLSIQNFTIIQQLDLELHSGMTVLTGETGAGKSILIDALLLALGDRADSKVVRHGSDRCSISADFNINALPAAQAWLDEHELASDQQCILRRTISADGRSRAFINDQAISLQLLRELGSLLISIHGQHEHQTLLKTEHQRLLLDAYAGHQNLVKQVADAYQNWHAAQEEFAILKNQCASREARLEFLTYQVAEFEKLNLQTHELAELDQEQKQLANADNLLAGAQQALSLLAEHEDGNVIQWLHKTQTILNFKKDYAPQFNTISELLNNALIQVDEAVNELTHYCEKVNLNPERLHAVEQRLGLIHEMARKHKVAPENLVSLHEQLNTELQNLTHSDERLQQLEQQIEALNQQYTQAAKELTKSRKKAIAKLAPAVEANMHKLNMAGGRFTIQLEETQQFTSHGSERVEFLVSANPGQPMQSLAKVASGGELSRISLTIHVLTAQTMATPTLIFDEVDVGIGGGTAEIVGRLLRQLGKATQVLCVTHLPQVAALGHHHLQVGKNVQNNQTQTEVKILDKTLKVSEIARMLGGIKVTEQTLAHAKEMVDCGEECI